ncbi:MAG: hypothetical protein M1817_001674 [Caeruleum heppii]|nr:MAG: hypothetical protein M1817_001674 [Caeruleum heppii]
MADKPSFYLHKEIRVNLEPVTSTTTVTVQLPALGPAKHHVRNVLGRLRGNGKSNVEDEAAFAKSHLASSASIYFRKSKRYPRSFLWRILGESKILSIQSVDLSRTSEKAHEASLTLNLLFPTAIRPSGVVLSDYHGRHHLTVCVLTVSSELYTLTLRPEFFRQPAATRDNVDSWCKIQVPASFSFRYPHRVVAKSPQELLVSLHDGGLLRLTRNDGEAESTWTETSFNEGGWGSSLRGLIPWQGNNTVRYDGLNLEYSTATSIAFSPPDADDVSEHVFLVCLDHTLKAWNLRTGKVGCTRDLLGHPRTPHDLPKYLIDPSHSSLVTVTEQLSRRDGDQYYIVTFSPVAAGQLKFWAVVDPDHPDGIRDLFPDVAFEPPSPSLEIWTVAHFRVASVKDTGLTTLWVLWKNNTNYRVQSLTFDLLRLPEEWKKTWCSTATESLREVALPTASALDSFDATNKWLDYLFYPGRFTDATLLTALSIYNQDIHLPKDALAKQDRGVKERVCTSVGSSVTLSRDAGGDMDYQRFRHDTDFQWRRYYRLVAELDKRRGEALSLVYDGHADMPWVVSTDCVTAIRECNETERLWHNRGAPQHFNDTMASHQFNLALVADPVLDLVRMAGLIKAASAFRRSSSGVLQRGCLNFLNTEMFREASHSVNDRVRAFYEQCGFADQIGDEEFGQLANALAEIGGFETVDTILFQEIIDTIAHKLHTSKPDTFLTLFGETALIRGAQEMINLNYTVLLDLMLLFVFLVVDDAFEDEPTGTIDVPIIYTNLLALLKEYSVVDWLARTSREEAPRRKKGASTPDAQQTDDPDVESQSVGRSTILQYPFTRIWEPLWNRPHKTMAKLLTESAKGVLTDIGLSDPDIFNHRVLWLQRHLLAWGNLDLAQDFMRFQPNTAWSQYGKARYHLATQDHTMAALHFRKAAFKLSSKEGSSVQPTPDVDDLLSEDEVVEFFNAGLPKYYEHVISLFQREKAYSVAADFAETCLQFVHVSKSHPHAQDQRMKVLRCLFRCTIEITDYDRAYGALVRYTEKSHQSTDLHAFLKALCAHPSATTYLTSLPFLGLHAAVDAILLSFCQETPTTLTPSTPPYHKILYAWRIKRGDYRGAAVVLYDRLQRLEGSGPSGESEDEREAISRAYLGLINTLSVVGESGAWILTHDKEKAAADGAKRKVLTLTDIRKAYQGELDRTALIDNEQFAFEGGDDMDIG